MIKKSQLNNTFGHDREHWANAKEEARRVLSDIAVTSKLIEYGELTKRIQSIRFEPHGDDFGRFLGQLSREPDAAGLGMITAIVVHKEDQRPGNGFFTLAKELRREIPDDEKCWAREVERVFRHFAA